LPLEIHPGLTERGSAFFLAGVLLAAILDVASMEQAKTITCPDCGLILRVAAPGLHYDKKDWLRICTRVHLGGPAWCVVQYVGTHPLPLARSPRSAPRNDRLHANN